MRDSEIRRLLNSFPNIELADELKELLASRKAIAVLRHGLEFYTIREITLKYEVNGEWNSVSMTNAFTYEANKALSQADKILRGEDE